MSLESQAPPRRTPRRGAPRTMEPCVYWLRPVAKRYRPDFLQITDDVIYDCLGPKPL